jgi:hypothetical protein
MFACKHNHAIVDLDNVVDHVTVLVETTVVECIHRMYFAKTKNWVVIIKCVSHEKKSLKFRFSKKACRTSK